jgi:hypothetical protein
MQVWQKCIYQTYPDILGLVLESGSPVILYLYLHVQQEHEVCQSCSYRFAFHCMLISII